jgi:hypothetical protein
MKKLILVLCLVSSSAFASTEECTSVLNNMTSLIYTYRDSLVACKDLKAKGEESSRAYEGYRRIARSTEETFARGKELCNQVCDDTFFCEGDMAGACQ